MAKQKLNRNPIETYVYSEDGIARKFKTINEASEFTGDTPPTIGNRLRQNSLKLSPRRFLYSARQLTAKDVQKAFDDAPKPKRANNECKEKQNNYEYEVDCKDRKVFYFERSKEGRKKQLKQYIYNKLQYHWMTIDKRLAALEKRFLKDIINSL